MGLFIEINKIEEKEQEVFYSFCTSEGNAGKVSINKDTGEFFVIEEPAWDKNHKLASRVGIKLEEHWEKGEFPDITCWAS